MPPRPVRLVPGLLLACLVAAAGCLDAFAPDVGPPVPMPTCNDDRDPAQAVSFQDDVSPIFRRACDGCHTAGGEGVDLGGLDLSTYASLRAGGMRSVDTIVVGGEPCASVLWQKIGPAPPFGARMPKDDPALPAAEIDLIHDWIAEGARE
jgi:mono/diheme cytochrome c family protein